MARKNIAAGNWKMNTLAEDAAQLSWDIVKGLKKHDTGDAQLLIFPPFINIPFVAGVLRDEEKVSYGAQNCHQNESGAFTGEVAASMIAATGASHVLIGHSERREYFGENEALLADKIRACHKSDLIAIYCCGEVEAQRRSGDYLKVIDKQIREGLIDFKGAASSRIIVAYEPVWAIGTGLTASPEEAQEVHAFIRKTLSEIWSQNEAQNTSILYGGSVKPSNAKELFSQTDIDGGLIGGASLKAEDFIQIAASF